MRKAIQIVVVTLFSLSLTTLLYGVISKIIKEKQVKDKIGLLPSFSFITLARSTFHSSAIKKGPILIVRFHPECEHCQYEISQIFKSDIPALVTNVLLISSDHPDSIGEFLKQFNYTAQPKFVALADTLDSFYKIFGKDIIPSNYIYNKDLRLVKVFFGEVKTETLRKYLQPGE